MSKILACFEFSSIFHFKYIQLYNVSFKIITIVIKINKKYSIMRHTISCNNNCLFHYECAICIYLNSCYIIELSSDCLYCGDWVLGQCATF